MNRREFCMAVVENHLKELGIEINCNIEFFPSSNKIILLPENIYGVYDSTERVAYIRETSLPRMIETLAHEVAHDFLLNNSRLGQELINHDILIKTRSDGNISTEIEDNHRTLHTISKFVNEGFATFSGCYVLKRFVHEISNCEYNFSKDEMRHMLDIFLEALSMYDRRPFDYYYGRLEFERISTLFTSETVTTAALVSMNVTYNINLNEVLDYYKYMRKKIYSKKDLSEPDITLDLSFYETIPHFRILIMSRMLPKLAGPIIKIEKESFLKLIRQTLGEKFLEITVSELYYPLSPIRLGYLLGEYERTKDGLVFYSFRISEDLLIRLNYGELKIYEVCKIDKNVYIGYLLSKLKNASNLRTKEILKKLALLNVKGSRELLNNIEYMDKIRVDAFVEKVLREHEEV